MLLMVDLLSPDTGEVEVKIILISGVARSGTSILGKLIGSFKDVTYVYEPWFLAQLSCLTKPQIKEMLPRFFHELMVAEQRKGGVERQDSYPGTLITKMVNLQEFFEPIKEALPEIKIIEIIRDRESVAKSINKKGWYTVSGLSRPSLSPKRIINGATVPFWADAEFLEVKNKGEYCWDRLAGRGVCDYVLSYQAFCRDPGWFAEDLAKFLGLEYGKETKSVIKEIR